MNILELIKDEIIQRSNEFQYKTKGTKDEYNLYEEHVKYVYRYANILSNDDNVDKEVCLLSALLHDISMTNASLDRSKHNEFSAKITGELLEENDYPKEKIGLIKKCILNHSSKRKEYRTTKEENILVDADALAHFDCTESLYNLASNVMRLNEEESLKFVKDKLTKDYNEISDKAKKIINDKYVTIMACKCYNELMSLSKKVTK